MNIVDHESVGNTLAHIELALESPSGLSKEDSSACIDFLARRADQPGAYRRGMIAPSPQDYAEGMMTCTGDRIVTRAGIAHAMGEEALRMLARLDAPQDTVARIAEPMLAVVNNQHSAEWFCCGRCTVAMWRAVLSGAYGNGDAYFATRLRAMKMGRRDGQWEEPFYYALSALIETPGAAATDELHYAQGTCNNRLRFIDRTAEPYRSRRQKLLQSALAF